MFTLTTEQWVPKPPADVFAYFAIPQNLRALTPPKLHLQIVRAPDELKLRSRLEYRIRIRLLTLKWESEITEWDPPQRFVDVQRRGPYRMWIHEHAFKIHAGGTMVSDRIQYEVPGGRWVQRWFVEPQLERMFNYRRERLREIFG